MTLSVSNLGIDGLEDIEQIGTGGSSRVYRARQADLDRVVAVKVLNPGHNQGVAKRFDRERKAMGRLSLHEGIVPVYSSGITAHGEPYLVMPYYANGSLQDLIDTGPMEWQTAVSYIDVAAETIAAAHEEGVVHLDLKPANILLTNHGAPRIADFGIARLTTGQGSSAGTTGGAAFTPAYSAPETFLDGETGPPSDVYGLGATLWAILVGHPPFLTPGEDTNLMAVIGRVVNNPIGDLRHFTPSSICDVIERAMAKRPEDRYQTAREFSMALKNAAASASPEFQPAQDRTRGTILFPAGPAPAAPPSPNGSDAAATGRWTQLDPVELPPSIASTAPPPASRSLLQESAEPLSRPVGGQPPVDSTPILDLDRFRFGPILFGLIAFLGVVGVAFWALNRSPDGSALEGDLGVTVTNPAGPDLERPTTQAVTTSSTSQGDDGSSSLTSSSTTEATTASSVSTTATTAASTSTTRPSSTSASTTTQASTSTSSSTTGSSTTTSTTTSTSTTTGSTTTTSTSSSSSSTSLPTEPPELQSPSATMNEDTITVTFSSNQCVTYRMRAVPIGGGSPSPVVIGPRSGCTRGTSVTIPGVVADTAYTVNIVIVNAAGTTTSGQVNTPDA